MSIALPIRHQRMTVPPLVAPERLSCNAWGCTRDSAQRTPQRPGIPDRRDLPRNRPRGLGPEPAGEVVQKYDDLLGCCVIHVAERPSQNFVGIPHAVPRDLIEVRRREPHKRATTISWVGRDLDDALDSELVDGL